MTVSSVPAVRATLAMWSGVGHARIHIILTLS